MIRAAATEDTNIIFGATVDDRLNGQVWVTVVATGFGGRGRASARRRSGRRRAEQPRRQPGRAATSTCRPSCAPEARRRDGHVPRDRVEARRARDYADTPIPHEVGQRILDAGRLSGSSRNTQRWEFVVVSGAAQERLADAVYAPENVRSAALVVAIVGEAGGFDVGRCAQNMMLAAWDDGVVSCPNGVRDADAAARDLRRRRCARFCSFGYPARPRNPDEPHRRGVVGAARTASRWPSSCAKSRSSAGSAGSLPANAATRLCTSTSNAIRTMPGLRACRSTIPSGLRTRQPVEACQYGDQRTATRYFAGRGDVDHQPRLAELDHARAAGPVDDRLRMRNGVDRDLVGREHASQAGASAAHEPLLGT